jgi:hypothetical protein
MFTLETSFRPVSGGEQNKLIEVTVNSKEETPKFGLYKEPVQFSLQSGPYINCRSIRPVYKNREEGRSSSSTAWLIFTSNSAFPI